MSPHHKRIIPAMAEKYGFEYEFVTYKWPHWLHKQTDKQRIIWAYKILFLDVLFPLDVPRMIFVDSDQVIRTDLAELYNMDLKVQQRFLTWVHSVIVFQSRQQSAQRNSAVLV